MTRASSLGRRAREGADMQLAVTESEMQEAAAFVAYLGEFARPLDEMFRAIFGIAAGNVGLGGAATAELCRARIVTDALHDNWTAEFELAADGSELAPSGHARRYVRALRG